MRKLTAAICAVTIGMALCAFSAVPPPESTSASALDNKDAGKQETSVGSLVADAFRAAAHTDIALVAAGDLKKTDDPLPAGKVQSSDVSGLLAYPDDRLVVLALDGRKLRQALETSVSTYPRSGVAFLQVSGVKFTFDSSKSAGQRVTSVTIGATPIADDEAYTVAVMSSLADGALGYWKVWSKRNVISRSGVATSSAAIDSYFRANSKLDYSALNRISLAKQ
jgi:2',3'-cyclic-nucleotide 2'-phosphodiesterase (5'-nucleotidase family)